MNDGPHASLWKQGLQAPGFGALDRDLAVNVAVIGAGITGLTAAYALQKAGYKVAIIEQQGLADGMSGHTTAHLTQIFDTPLKQLLRTFGERGARTVWDAGRRAIETIAGIARQEGIACDFQRVPAYFFAVDRRGLTAVDEEIRLARRLGFAARRADDLPYPAANLGALRLDDQARFHPGRYLYGLARVIAARGGHLYTRTHVGDVTPGPVIVLHANGHTVTADQVVFATHQPLRDPMLVTKVVSHQTYAVGVQVAKGTFADALAWDTESPYHYWRQQPGADYDTVIIGGADHRTGQGDAQRAFEQLEAYVRATMSRYDHVISHRWSGQWLAPVDGIPFIGRNAEAENEYVGTGYAGNGMTMGTFAGLLIADLIVGRPVPEARLFSPARLSVRGVAQLVRANLSYPIHLVTDRLRQGASLDLAAIRPGDGRLVQLNGEQVAAARDEQGRLHLVSATCTHMGCLVQWNGAAASWDCPCHGSRFTPTGEVINGPAMQALPPVTGEREAA